MKIKEEKKTFKNTELQARYALKISFIGLALACESFCVTEVAP